LLLFRHHPDSSPSRFAGFLTGLFHGLLLDDSSFCSFFVCVVRWVREFAFGVVVGRWSAADEIRVNIIRVENAKRLLASDCSGKGTRQAEMVRQSCVLTRRGESATLPP
jgi:hypothetical protein